MANNEQNFCHALRNCIVDGVRIRRSSWEGTPCFVMLAKDVAVAIGENEFVDMGQAIICRTGTGSFVPWIPTQSDLLADDWQWLCNGSWVPCESEASAAIEFACCEECG